MVKLCFLILSQIAGFFTGSLGTSQSRKSQNRAMPPIRKLRQPLLISPRGGESSLLRGRASGLRPWPCLQVTNRILPGKFRSFSFPWAGVITTHRRLSLTWSPLARFLAGALIWATPAHARPTGPVDFQRDIRPILADACFKCHGPDEVAREAKLRLDTREGALQERNGIRAVVPGQPAESELLLRVTSNDPEERMPPPDKNPNGLTPGQIDRLRQWISEGAKWQDHWSFTPPVKPPIPVVEASRGIRNPIDNFVLARLRPENLTLSAEADRATLLRRVTHDLTGLPPTLAELDAFLADPSPNAYEHAVARILAAPAYGERMAVGWLDAARYADTNGYFSDTTRQVWPWRDWVINAFNRNVRFDQFTIEQLAGDLLPTPTRDQLIATGFNRNSMANNETGAIDEEYRVEYAAERLETTGTVWLGLTLGCARCHDHKYDPISQREFYQLFAFFNNSPEKGLITKDDPPPSIEVATPAQRAELGNLTKEKHAAEAIFGKMAADLRAPIKEWESQSARELAPPEADLALHLAFEPESAGVLEKGNVKYGAGLIGAAGTFDGMQHLEVAGDSGFSGTQAWSIGVWLKPTGSLSGVLSKIEPAGDRRGFEIVWKKGRFQVNLVHRWGVDAIEVVTRDAAVSRDWQQVIISYDGSQKSAGLRVYVNGVRVALDIARDTLSGSVDNAEPLRVGRRDGGLGFYGELDELRWLRRGVDENTAQAWYWGDRIRGVLALEAGKRGEEAQRQLTEYYVSRHASEPIKVAHQAMAAARAAEAAFRTQLPKTLVMQDRPDRRATHLLKRGQYDQPSEEVHAAVPASLPPFSAGWPRNRLGLARWLISPDHPLTARVQVNRLWMQCFGEGLVRTVNDFGSQGEPPTHPELLDWLAVQFVQSGWDVKETLRLIVTSAVYRQTSAPTPELLAHDPDNRLLGRGPRFRLAAEFIRDQALAAAGLLVARVGGPSVLPYQPAGLWETVTYDGEVGYQQAHGESLWRRSLYTFWKRQAPPPGMLVFDGPTRETCIMQRARTNSPMQALALLNDDTFVEAARGLAALTLTHGGRTTKDQLTFAFRRVTARPPATSELSILEQLLDRQRARFSADLTAAKNLLSVGAAPIGRDRAPAETAAWTAVSQALFNLDETITRR